MERLRYIDAPKEVKDDIIERYGISPSTMDSALRFSRSGEKSKQIRDLIMATGKAVVMNRIPECETIHDASGKMTQIFPNGYTLVLDKETEDYVVVGEGSDEVVMSGKIPTIARLIKIQNIIQHM